MTTLSTADLDKHNDVSVIRHIDIEPQSHRPNHGASIVQKLYIVFFLKKLNQKT